MSQAVTPRRARPVRHHVPGSAAEAARTSTACVTCRHRKIKCSGTQPCRFCSRRRQPCVFPEATTGRKKLYPVAYVDDLERQLAFQKSQVQAGSGIECPDQQDSPLTRRSIASPASSSQHSALIPEPALTSSLQFGTRIKSLSKGLTPARDQHRQPSGALPEPLEESDSPSDVYHLMSRGEGNRPGDVEIQWPSEERAHLLLETFLNSLSTVQHLVDPREFSDRVASFYCQPPTQKTVVTNWHVEFLLVMAIGEMIYQSSTDSSTLPGTEYFKQAISQLPSITVLRHAGSMAVEILCLAAFYLQCADCKEDAYVYAGLGLRLAVSSGLARQEGHKRTSEATHRNRLWWTIYMQERRLAAATGNPVGINDDAVITPLPINTPGFQPAEPLTTNIKIAKITGSMIQDIYGRRHQSERDFVLRIQSALTSISEIQKSMPPDYTVDLSDESRAFTRTGATLYLMLFQAIILATRTTLLYMARSRLQQESHNSTEEPAESSLLERFCRPCVDAAKHTLITIETMRKQNLLTTFGFFDLDALFSAAFVFVMAELAGIGATTRSDLRNAVAHLTRLRDLGNKAAGSRLADIRQMCSRLDVDIDPGRTTYEGTRDYGDGKSAADVVMEVMSDGNEPTWIDHPWNGLDELLKQDLDVPPLGGEQLDLDAFWQSQDLVLDGTVETDWGELERVASQF